MPKTYENVKPKKKKHFFWRLLSLLILLLIVYCAYFYISVGAIVPDRTAETANLQHTVNILLIGADYNEIGKTEGRSDSIMFISLNLKEKSVLVMSLPRDTYVSVKGHGKTKLNHAFAYGGVDLLRSTVEELLGLPIDYYAATNFAGFEQIIDALGGIDIEVDKDMDYVTYYDHIQLKKGLQHLDGKHALQFVRFRHDPLGDINRVERQQKFVQAVIDKMTSARGLLAMPAVIKSAFEIIDTDLNKTDLLRLGINGIFWDLTSIETATMPGTFKTINNLSYWQPDNKKLQSLIKEKIYFE